MEQHDLLLPAPKQDLSYFWTNFGQILYNIYEI